jgi:hypothetical protein
MLRMSSDKSFFKVTISADKRQMCSVGGTDEQVVHLNFHFLL